MQRDLDALDAYLHESGMDGYLIDAPGTVADQWYLTGFGAVDPFTSLYTNGQVHLLVRGLDRGLARESSRADSVQSSSDFNRRAKVEQFGETKADHRVVAEFLAQHNAEAVAVPARFPLGRADGLRALGITVEAEDEAPIGDSRAIKTSTEIDHIRSAQRATEAAMKRAEELLCSADASGEILQLEGKPLTSERIKRAIELTLVSEGCALEDTIVAGGAQAAHPHERGSGPLRPHEPIVIDIFPRDKTTRYHADMTRTFCVGAPSENARAWYDLTHDALETALSLIQPGVTGEEVHEAVCAVFEEAGIPTTRSDEGTETGFTHGTGHGVGLEVHEAPRLSTNGGPLEPGHVVTVEPGLYDPDVGGIRIEDLVVVTEDGYENLTTYEKQFQIA